jgi:hypothetical protein
MVYYLLTGVSYLDTPEWAFGTWAMGFFENNGGKGHMFCGVLKFKSDFKKLLAKLSAQNRQKKCQEFSAQSKM